MKFNVIQTLRDERESAWRIWKTYYDRVAAGEVFLDAVRNIFEREVRALDWAITKLERMEQCDLHD